MDISTLSPFLWWDIMSVSLTGTADSVEAVTTINIEGFYRTMKVDTRRDGD
jgi:hypothetical protein